MKTTSVVEAFTFHIVLFRIPLYVWFTLTGVKLAYGECLRSTVLMSDI